MSLDFSPYKKVIIEGEVFDTGSMMARPYNTDYINFMMAKIGDYHEFIMKKYNTPLDAFRPNLDKIKELMPVITSGFEFFWDHGNSVIVFKKDVSKEADDILRSVFDQPISTEPGVTPDNIKSMVTMMITIHLIAYIMNRKKFNTLEELSVMVYILYSHILLMVDKVIGFVSVDDMFKDFGGIGSGG